MRHTRARGMRFLTRKSNLFRGEKAEKLAERVVGDADAQAKAAAQAKRDRRRTRNLETRA